MNLDDWQTSRTDPKFASIYCNVCVLLSYLYVRIKKNVELPYTSLAKTGTWIHATSLHTQYISITIPSKMCFSVKMSLLELNFAHIKNDWKKMWPYFSILRGTHYLTFFVYNQTLTSQALFVVFQQPSFKERGSGQDATVY